MDYNNRAINTLCNRKNLIHVMDDVLYGLNVDDEASFGDVMEQILADFEQLVSEMVASKVIGIDLAHYYLRSKDAMSSHDVQDMLDNMVFKAFDLCVNRLLQQIEQGDDYSAWNTYQYTLKNRRLDQPDLSAEAFNDYLQQVNIDAGIVASEVLARFFTHKQ
jgi:hypothetical protein